MRLIDSLSSFLYSNRRNSESKLAQVPEQIEFTYGGYLVAAGYVEGVDPKRTPISKVPCGLKVLCSY